MSLTLGPIFDTPLHPKPWCSFGADRYFPGPPPRGNVTCPRLDYRITGTFTDIDRINGGPHQAVDAGNASMGHPIFAPASCPIRRLHHFDGARGREMELGGGWFMRVWHVAAESADPPRPTKGTASGPWVQAIRGQRAAWTGDTGLGTGAHTHIELWQAGKRVDPEPHLYIDGKPGQPIEGATDDMAHFTDVDETHPFYHDIEWAAENGLTAGIPNGDGTFRFEPERAVKRSELMAFLHRHDDAPEAHA